MKFTIAISVLIGLILVACTTGVEITPAEAINYTEFCSAYTVHDKCNADSVCNWDGKCLAK